MILVPQHRHPHPPHQRWWMICSTFMLIASTIFIDNVQSSYTMQSLFGSGGGGNSGGGGSSSQSSLGSSFGSFTGGGGGGGGGQISQGSQGPVQTAIESTRTVEVKPIQIMNEPHEPQVVEVPSEDMPVTVHFKSQSSRVLVQQTHAPAQIGEPEHTTSEDEPQRVIHEVVKPVIQEIREIIQPYRRLIQQVQPVIEQTHTVIAKGEPRPPVEPIPVPGASPGVLSIPGGGGRGGGGIGGGGIGGGGLGGSGQYGGGSGYASAASSVSLKQASAPQQQQQQQQKQQASASSSGEVVMIGGSGDHHRKSSSSVRNGPQSGSYSLQPVSKQSGSSNSIQKYGQQQQQHQMVSKQYGAQNSYASRRGEFREPQQMEKFDQPRMSLRPAPASMNLRATQTRVSLKGHDSLTPSASSSSNYAMRSMSSESMPSMARLETYPQQQQQQLSSYQPQQISSYQQQSQQQIQPRIDEQPSAPSPQSSSSSMMPISSYSHQYSYSPIQPYHHHHEDNLAPLITFIAQPVRFRARA